MESENTKKQKKKINKKKLVIILIALILVFFLIVGFIVIYVLLHDSSRNKYKSKELAISEVINKNYIDGFSNVGSTGEFSFSLSEDDVNEMLSLAKEKLNDKYIESIYYSKGLENHHYFYFDLKVPVIKTRVILDTLSYLDEESKCFYLSIVDTSIGKTHPYRYLKEKGYISQEFCEKIAKYSGLPISYNDESNYIKYEPLKFIDEFNKGKIASLVFDVVNKSPSIISLEQSNLSFKINLSSFQNPDYFIESEIIEVVNLYSRVKTSLDSLDSSSLVSGEKYVASTLSSLELTRILNNSFNEVSDVEVISSLTSNKLKYVIKGVYISIPSSDLIRISLNLSINGYIVNTNVEVDTLSNVYDFNILFSIKEEFMIGSIKYSGGDNHYVRFINSLLNDTFLVLKERQPKAFTSNPLVDEFSIYLNGISDELSDPILKSAAKEVNINPLTSQLEFIITRTI